MDASQPSMITVAPSAYAGLEQRLGYVFLDIKLCETALTHKSWLNESATPDRTDNERLEFLGDAVVALVVSDLLMRRFPTRSEGELSKIRAAIVNEAGLAAVADALAVGPWIFLGRGEEQAGGRQKRSILSDTFEALIGAVYLDGGFAPARALLERLLEPSLDTAEGVAERDFKSRLQELSQARLHLAPVYTVVGESGPEHAKMFEVAIALGGREYGRGQGKSKKEAQQNAAAIAVAALEREAASPPR